jgi:trimeric autotransporter adhesin
MALIESRPVPAQQFSESDFSDELNLHPTFSHTSVCLPKRSQRLHTGLERKTSMHQSVLSIHKFNVIHLLKLLATQKQLYILAIWFLVTLFIPQPLQGAQLNTSLGEEALQSNTTGIDNTAIGFRALQLNTTESGNSALGANALAHNTGGRENTAVGSGALFTNTTGIFNTATGYQALVSNTSGAANTATGDEALHLNTTGFDNTATGHAALLSNTTGSRNTAIGKSALASSKTGSFNVADGYNALMFNTDGTNNTAIGSEALSYNSTGYFNTATGNEGLYSNTIGHENTANGNQALCSNTTGYWNTAMGFKALFSNTGPFTDYVPDIDGRGVGNTATGHMALFSNTIGHGNVANGLYALALNTIASNGTACGYGALFSNTTGQSNTAVGVWALHDNISGEVNTAVGRVALSEITTGYGNTAVGSYSGPWPSVNTDWCTFVGSSTYAPIPVSNSTALGHATHVSADNQVRIGSIWVTSIGGQVNFTAFSDSRYKKNIRENVPGLAFITKLRPITYTLDVEGLDTKLTNMRPQSKIDPTIALPPHKRSTQESKAREEKAKIVYTGFAAEEVEQVAKELSYQFSGVDAPKNKDDFMGCATRNLSCRWLSPYKSSAPKTKS